MHETKQSARMTMTTVQEVVPLGGTSLAHIYLDANKPLQAGVIQFQDCL